MVDKEIIVQADPQKLGQMLTNLIGNALKFTDTGEIVLSSREENEKVIILVSDSGIGISPGNQKKLFAKFQQISSQQAGRPAGTGLGLYISREYARMMGGDLWLVSSVMGKGAAFAFSLPKAGSALASNVRRKLTRGSQNAIFLDN
jgi:signal transduction histidine kinase